MNRRQLIKHTLLTSLGITTFSSIIQMSDHQIANSLNSHQELSNLIRRLMKDQAVPGLAIAIINNGQLLWSDSFGVTNTRSKQPVTNKTIFHAASLSKPLFAYAVMKLVEQGKIELDRPLTDYTPKPYISDPRIDQITARMLLSHQGGFPEWSGDKPVWIQYNPGTRFNYSGEGYYYLQQVVEQITQEPFNNYIIRTLLQPLQMNNSSFLWRSNYDQLATNGHDRIPRPQALRQPKIAMSAGSLRTTAIEYAQFLIAMMQVGEINSPLLTSTSINQMLTPQIKINSNIDWGLGWILEETPTGKYFWHWGDTVFFKNFTIGSLLTKSAVVILTNGQNGLKICQPIVNQILGGSHRAFRLGMIKY